MKFIIMHGIKQKNVACKPTAAANNATNNGPKIPATLCVPPVYAIAFPRINTGTFPDKNVCCGNDIDKTDTDNKI